MHLVHYKLAYLHALTLTQWHDLLPLRQAPFGKETRGQFGAAQVDRNRSGRSPFLQVQHGRRGFESDSHLAEEAAGRGIEASRQVFGSPCGDDPTARCPRARSQFQNIVRRPQELQVVFHHNQGMPG